MTWEEVIKPRFLQAADRNERALIDNLTLDVVPYPKFQAGVDGKTGHIVVNAAFTLIANYWAMALLTIGFHPECHRYFDEFGDRMLRAYEELNDSGRLHLPTMYEVCHLTPQDETPDEHKAAGTIIGNFMADTLALAIGHEIGHVWQEYPWSDMHPRCSLAPHMPPHQRIEVCADDFGRSLSLKAGFAPYSAIGTTFSMFALKEGVGTVDSDGAGTHPAASCRTLIMAKAMLDDPTWAPAPQDTLQIRKIKESIKTQLEELIKVINTPIPKAPGNGTLCPTPID